MKATVFAERVASYATVTTISIILDDILWPAMMLWQGSIAGGITMFWITLLDNLILIWAYDKIKKDVFAFEALRELTEQEHKGLGKKLLVWFIKAGQVPAFIAISFWDPFLSVIYMRKGAEKYKMEKRDWWYFGLAMVIACTGWTLCWQGVFITVKAVLGI